MGSVRNLQAVSVAENDVLPFSSVSWFFCS